MKLPLLLLMLFYYFNCSAQLKSELLAAIKNPKQNKTTVLNYLKLVKFYSTIQLDSSIYYAEEGLILAQKLNDKEGEAKLLSQMALAYEGHDNLMLAEKLYNDAYTILKNLSNSEKEVATLVSSIGVIEGKRGNYLSATNHFMEALKIFKTNNDRDGIAYSYLRLGVVNERNGNLDKALEYYNLSQTNNEEGKMNNLYFTLLNNIGIIYAQKGDIKKALEYFEKGIEQIKGTEFISLNISLLNNCMKAYSQIGNKQKALAYHQLVLDVSKKYNLPSEEARALYNYAFAFWEENPTKAITLLNQALKIAISINEKVLESNVYELLSYININENNYKDAYTNLLAHHNIKDSIFNTNKSKTLISLFSSFEMKSSKAKINELQLENEKTTHQRNLVIIAIVGALIILLLLGYYLKRIRLLNSQLSVSNKIKDKLFSVIGHDLRSSSSNIYQGLVLLNDNSVLENDRHNLQEQLIKHAHINLNTLTALLSWGETQLKGFKPKQSNTNIYEIANTCINFFEADLRTKAVTIMNNIPTKMLAFVDSNHLEIILRNLISNSLKFSKENSTIELNSSISSVKASTIISVKDAGIGMSKEKQLQFLHSSIDIEYGTKGEKGTGLGLLLVKEFITINNGKIWIESKENEGTTFFVEFPNV